MTVMAIAQLTSVVLLMEKRGERKQNEEGDEGTRNDGTALEV